MFRYMICGLLVGATAQCIAADQQQNQQNHLQDNVVNVLQCAICQNPRCLGVLPGVCGRVGQNQQRPPQDFGFMNRLAWKLMPIDYISTSR